MSKILAAFSSQSLSQDRNGNKQYPRLGDESLSFFEDLCKSLTLDPSVQNQGQHELNEEQS